MKRILYLLVISSFAWMQSCGNDEADGGAPGVTGTVYNYYTFGHYDFPESMEKEKAYVLRSSGEVEVYLKDIKIPHAEKIDSGDYTAILCGGIYPYQFQTMNQKVTRQSENLYRYTIDIHQSGLLMPAETHWITLVLVPTMPLDASVELEITSPHGNVNSQESYSDYDISGITWNDSFTEDQLYVIRSVAELEELMVLSADNSYAAIREGETILLCGSTSPNLIETISKELNKISDGVYNFDIKVYQSDATALEQWKLAVVVEGLPAKARVSLNIQNVYGGQVSADFSDYNVDGITWNDSFRKNTLYILRSDSELEELMDSSAHNSHSGIKSGETLLLCRSTSCNLIDRIDKDLAETGSGRYLYTVNVYQNGATALEDWVQAVVVKNLPGYPTVDLVINHIGSGPQFFGFTDYDVSGITWNESFLSGKLHVVRSTAELERFMASGNNSYMPITEGETLLLARASTPTLIHSIARELTRIAHGFYQYNVKEQLYDATQPDDWTNAILVRGMKENPKIEFNIVR